MEIHQGPAAGHLRDLQKILIIGHFRIAEQRLARKHETVHLYINLDINMHGKGRHIRPPRLTPHWRRRQRRPPMETYFIRFNALLKPKFIGAKTCTERWSLKIRRYMEVSE